MLHLTACLRADVQHACSTRFEYRNSWNIAGETETAFKRRMEWQFERFVIKSELTLLDRSENEMPWQVSGDQSNEKRKKLTQLSGNHSKGKWKKLVRREFEAELTRYVTRMRHWKLKAKTNFGLLETNPKSFEAHADWLVFYQVPYDDNSCQPFSAIEISLILIVLVAAELGAWAILTAKPIHSRDKIRKDVGSYSRMIDLPLRNPCLHAGRRSLLDE